MLEDSRRNRDKFGIEETSKSRGSRDFDPQRSSYSTNLHNFDSLLNLNVNSKFLHKSPNISNRNHSSSIDNTTRNLKNLENFLNNNQEKSSVRDCKTKQEFNLFKTER